MIILMCKKSYFDWFRCRISGVNSGEINLSGRSLFSIKSPTFAANLLTDVGFAN